MTAILATTLTPPPLTTHTPPHPTTACHPWVTLNVSSTMNKTVRSINCRVAINSVSATCHSEHFPDGKSKHASDVQHESTKRTKAERNFWNTFFPPTQKRSLSKNDLACCACLNTKIANRNPQHRKRDRKIIYVSWIVAMRTLIHCLYHFGIADCNIKL